jgi:LacI family transcriptional regulator
VLEPDRLLCRFNRYLESPEYRALTQFITDTFGGLLVNNRKDLHMSSVRAIAKQAGVSITTVSRVLNNGPSVNARTRERVLKVANRFGYVPNVGKRVTTYVALCYTRGVTISDPFDASLVGGISRGIDEYKFDLVVLNLQRDKKPDESYTQFFRRKGVRGVIVRTVGDTRYMCEEIAEEGFPHVIISDRFEQSNVNYIDCDSRPDTQRAIEYLMSLGHERIGFSMHSTQDRDHLDRFEGYKAALMQRDMPYDEKLIFRHPYTTEGGAAAMNMAISMRPRPTAIFFADPMTAVGAVKRAHELGVRVPDDISIVGFDDTDARRSVHPTLTAVCQDASRLGFEAALWLTRYLNQSGAASLRKTIPTFFEVNQSTAPPRVTHEPGNGANGAAHHSAIDSPAVSGASVVTDRSSVLDAHSGPETPQRTPASTGSTIQHIHD